MSGINQSALSDVKTRDLATLIGEVHIGNAATVAATTRWRSMGNIPGLKYNPNSDNKTTMYARRGIKRPAKAYNKMIEPKYEVNSNELTDRILNLVFFTDESYDFGSEGSNNAQTGLSAVAGTDFDFDEGSDGEAVAIGDRTDILDASGNRVIGITALVLTGVNTVYGAAGTSATLAENVDYQLDADLGQIRWLRAIDDDVITPTITSVTITSASSNYMRKHKPNLKGFVERACRVFWFDQDESFNWVMAHMDFVGRFIATDGPNADGDADAETKVEITILDEGYVLKREG